MKKINIHDAKTHLSGYLEDLANGEIIILCKRNVPVAEIRGIQAREGKRRRPTGLDKGEFSVADTFFDPLPEDVVAAFNGESQ